MRQDYSGRAPFLADQLHRVGEGRTLFVVVACQIEGFPQPTHALLDTAAQWCMLPRDLAEWLGLEPQGDSMVQQSVMLTRHGRITGYLWPLRTYFPAEEGEGLEVEATWFVSAEWPGPAVIGWKGCLERISIGLNPGTIPDTASFYFGPL